MKNPIDADRLKLFDKPQRKEYMRQCDMADGGCNDAELIDEMRRAGDLKRLNPDEFVRPSLTLSPPVAEEAEGNGFKKGLAVIRTVADPLNIVPSVGIVQGVIAHGRFIRVKGRIYSSHLFRPLRYA